MYTVIELTRKMQIEHFENAQLSSKHLAIRNNLDKTWEVYVHPNEPAGSKMQVTFHRSEVWVTVLLTDN